MAYLGTHRPISHYYMYCEITKARKLSSIQLRLAKSAIYQNAGAGVSICIYMCHTSSGMQAQVLVYVYICATQALECRCRCWYMYIYVPYKLWNAGAGVLCIFQGQMHKLVWYAHICSVWMPKLCLIEQLDN